MVEEVKGRTITRIRELPQYIGAFARNPINAMRIPLRLSWPAVLVMQLATGTFSGVCSGFLSRILWDFFAGLTLFPVLSITVGFVYSGFLYFWFSIFGRTYLDFRRLHSIVAVSLIPYFVLHVFAGYLPPMDLLGFAFTALLLVVGLTEQFQLTRRSGATAVSVLGILFFVVWTIAQIRADGGT